MNSDNDMVHDETSEGEDSSLVAAGTVHGARVVEVGPETITIELRAGQRASVAAAELAAVARVGDSFDVLVEVADPSAERCVASKVKADMLALWDSLAAAAGGEAAFEGEVVGPTKGGLIVDVGMRAFLPASQVELHPVDDLDAYVGKRFLFNVLEFDRKRGAVVVSRRAGLEKERAAQRAQTLKTLAAGDVVSGKVKSFTNYGAFVDIGGLDGLLHVSDLSWGHVTDPRQVLKTGESVKVKVLKIDSAKEKVSLGLKQLTPDPWAKVSERFPVGSRASASVLRLTEFGAFVELEPGLEGLVHVSEMSWTRRVRHPSELVQVGQRIDVVVLDLDAGQRRMSLGMKQTQENPWAALAKSHPVGSRVKGAVRSLTEYGIFVGLEQGIDGLVHVTDFSWSERPKHPGERFKKGDEVEAVVLGVDVAGERVSLGIKQLSEDPWLAFAQRHEAGSKVVGKITKVVDYGAFVEIEPGFEGLCHVSELSEDEVSDAHGVAKVGDSLEVVVLDVDVEARRVSLSVRALSGPPGSYRDYMRAAEAPRTTLGDALSAKLQQRNKS